jgi:hypothetical protein
MPRSLLLQQLQSVMPKYSFPAILEMLQNHYCSCNPSLTKFSLTKKGKPELKASVENCDFNASCRTTFSLMLSRQPITLGRQWRILQSHKYFIINFVTNVSVWLYAWLASRLSKVVKNSRLLKTKLSLPDTVLSVVSKTSVTYLHSKKR